MKRELLRFVCASLFALVCMNTQAQTTTFKYTATEKLSRFEEYNYFVGATGVVSHEWDEATGEGTVVYEGTVTEIGKNALLFNSNLTGIVIPEGVTKLGFQAFKGCSKMTTIQLPKSLTATEGLVFDGCGGLADGKLIVDDLAWWCSVNWGGPYSTPLSQAKHLYSDEDTEITSLVIPEGVTNIPGYAFYRCEGIASVSLPSTLKSIGESAFTYTGLTSVDIPVGITEIEEYAFANCGSLTTVTIPEGMTKIGFSAFAKTALTSLTLPSTITSMSQSFYGCENLATLTLTDGITTLGQSFYSCPALTSLNIPGSIKEIDYSDFRGCTGLTTVTLNEGTEKVEFSGCTNLETINFPSSIKEVYINGSQKLETVTLQEGVERISNFDNCTALKQINIPSTVTYVGTFRYCTALEKVIVADLASWCAARHQYGTSYGPQKYAGKLYLGTPVSHTEITDLVIPEGVTKISFSSFNDVTNIKTITLPSTLTSWEYKAFADCSGVTDVYCLVNPVTLTWSESNNNFQADKATQMHVLDVETWRSKFPDANATFLGDLTQISYTATTVVNAFGVDHFPGATALLANIYDSETGKGYAIFSGNLTAIADNAFANCTALTSIEIPDGITTIGSNAFSGCTGLTAMTLPKTVTAFGENAFAGLENIADVWCVAEPATMTWDGTGFMPSKATQMHVTIADDWTEQFPTANVTFVGDMTRFRYTATGKDSKSFYDLSKFTGANEMVAHDFNAETGEGSVIFKGVVTALGGYVFDQNDLFTSLTIPSSVTSIGSDAFARCDNLTTVSLPNTVTSLGNYLFWRSTSLTTVNIPTAPELTRLPEIMFSGCTSLADITIPDNITTIGYSAFSGCTAMTSIYIPASVATIESKAFDGCTALEKVITPSIADWCGINYTGNNAESNPLTYAHHLFVGSKESNTEVTDLVVPAGVEEIKALAFYGFSAMTSLTLPTTVTKLGNYAFYNCTGLTEVTLPEGVEDIGRGVFDGCTSLTSMVLPSTLTRIDYYAFMNVPQLTTVFCFADPATLSWQNNASQFLSEKATQFYVPDVDAWTEQFPDANVTFVNFTLYENLDNGTMMEILAGRECNVTLERTIQAGSYNSFAVPFDVSAEQLAAVLGEDVKVKELTASSLHAGTLSLTFADATSLEAGKPYLVMVSEKVVNPEFEGVTVSSSLHTTRTDCVDLVPTVGKVLVTGSEGYEDETKSVLFLGAANSLLYPTVVNDADNPNSYIKGFRAYFQLHDVMAPAIAFRMDFGDEVATGILSVESGQRTLDSETDAWYTLDGRRIGGKPAQKGVYIHSGKKVFVE
ncbi:MAG: leucine-rich repeat protein [Bacteroidaceae bacterium]|nr:leucine-rich repeat protein [Bacteroidaceae bacterium]